MSAGRLVEVADTRLYVRDPGGDGYPLLCAHGGPGLDHLTFADYLDPLAPRVRVILLDLRGHGRADEAPPESLTVARLAADVVQLAEALELGEYGVLGHSFGAGVALRLAVDHPTAADTLVLSGATPSLAALPSPEERVAHVSPELRRRLDAATDARESFHAYVAACFADEHDPRIDEYLRRREGTIMRLETAERLREDRAGRELADRLGEVRARTLVLHGARDRTTPPALAEQLATGIPGAHLRLFPNSGHFPFVEEQDAYLEALRRFLPD